MRVAAIQYKARRDAKPAALAALADAIRRAPPSDLVVLPEMAATGYLFDGPEDVARVAEPADGDTCAALAAAARDRGCWVVAGFAERDGDRFFNSALVLDPAGTRRFVYRKTLLYTEDERWATPGDSGYAMFQADGGDFTVGICMDLNDERFVAWCREQGTRAIAFPTNWVDEPGIPVHAYWAWRLQGVTSALVAANTYGTERDVGFSGESAILDGLVLRARAPKTGDCLIASVLG